MLHRPTLLASALGLVLLAPVPAGAQLPRLPGAAEPAPAAPAEDQAPAETAIQARREQLQAAMRDLRGRIAAAPPGATSGPEALQELEKIDRLLALQLAELHRTLEPAEKAPPPSLATRFEHPPPYSIAELDVMLDELEAAAAARQVSAAALQSAHRATESARAGKEEVERENRLARDQTPAPAGPEPGAEAALEELRLRRLQQHTAERDFEQRQTFEQRLEAQVQQLRGQLAPVAAKREAREAALDAKGEELDQLLGAARKRLDDADRHWSAIRGEIELAAAPGAGLLAQADAGRLEVATTQGEIELLSRQRERVDQLKNAWKLRFRVLSGDVSPSELSAQAKELGQQLDALERERRLAEARLAERRLALGALQDEEAAESPEPGVRRWLEAQEANLRRIVSLYEQELEDLDQALRLISRLRGEIETRIGGITAGERLSLLGTQLGGIWNFEVTSAADQAITVGKIVKALLLMLIGYLISRLLSRRLGRSLPRFGLTKGAAVAFQTLAFYLLLAIFFLWALRLVSIPLTVFTFVGGVLAIGIGFGSQNIMNNFISGLIILAEHPIKVGDLVDVDGIFGQVERIGPRSSRIRAGDNTHVIVPNSAFLEKNVLNWTVSDDVIRTSVDVGVAYGSPVEEVAKGLMRALAEEPGVLAQPPPEVLFMDFGDNALAFRAYFWVHVTRSLDRYRFQSALRFRIDRIFRQAGIVIAFPQRDVHFDAAAPLEIRLVGKEAE